MLNFANLSPSLEKDKIYKVCVNDPRQRSAAQEDSHGRCEE